MPVRRHSPHDRRDRGCHGLKSRGMKYRSVFEIIGPVMVGPSSSHTAGPVRIGQIARRLFGREPSDVTVRLYGSFAETYRGHATDVAVVGGILDYAADDPRIPDALRYARERGMAVRFIADDAAAIHPNALRITLADDQGRMEVAGASIGGGIVQITELNGFPLRLSGENPALLIFHRDVYGTVSSVAGVLAENQINISAMEVSRHEKGNNALMVIETDQPVPEEAVRQISVNADVKMYVFGG